MILWLLRVSWYLLWLVITQETFLRYVKRSRFSWPVAGRQLNKVAVFFFYLDPASLRAHVSCAQQTKHLKRARRLWPSPTKSKDNYLDHTAPQRDKSHFKNLLSKGLFAGGGPQISKVTCVESPHPSCKRDQIIMRDYVDRRVTPPERVTSPTWDPPPSCKQALKIILFFTVPVLVLIPKWYP